MRARPATAIAPTCPRRRVRQLYNLGRDGTPELKAAVRFDAPPSL